MPEISLTETRAIQWECQELMTTFYRSLDERNFERLLSTMDPDGTWDREGAVLRGRDAIRAAMAVRSKTMVVVHTLSTLQVTVRDSDAADLFAYMACFVSDTGAPPVFPIAMRGPKSVYICRGEFGRRDGRWLITRNWTEGPLFVAAA